MGRIEIQALLLFVCAGCIARPDVKEYSVARLNEIATGTPETEGFAHCNPEKHGYVHPIAFSKNGRFVAVANANELETSSSPYLISILAAPSDLTQAGDFVRRSQTESKVEMNGGAMSFRDDDELIVTRFFPLPWAQPDPLSATLESFSVDDHGALTPRVIWNPHPQLDVGLDILHTDDWVMVEQIAGPHQWVILRLPHGTGAVDPASITTLGTIPISDGDHPGLASGALYSNGADQMLISLEEQGRMLKVWDVSEPASPWLRSSQPVPANVAPIPSQVWGPTVAVDGNLVVVVPNGNNAHVLTIRSDGLLEPATSFAVSILSDRHLSVGLANRRLILRTPGAGFTVYGLDDPHRPVALAEHPDPVVDHYSFVYSPANTLVFALGCSGFAAFRFSE